MKKLPERWYRIATLYNDLVTLMKAAAQRPKIKAIKLHFRDQDQAKTLRSLFLPSSDKYKRVNRKVHSPFWKEDGCDRKPVRPFLYLRAGEAEGLRRILFGFLEAQGKKK